MFLKKKSMHPPPHRNTQNRPTQNVCEVMHTGHDASKAYNDTCDVEPQSQAPVIQKDDRRKREKEGSMTGWERIARLLKKKRLNGGVAYERPYSVHEEPYSLDEDAREQSGAETFGKKRESSGKSSPFTKREGNKSKRDDIREVCRTKDDARGHTRRASREFCRN